MGRKVKDSEGDNDRKKMTIGELNKIYYGPDRDGKNVSVNEIKGYEDSQRNNILSPLREKDVKRFFAPIGEVEKIPRNNQKKTNDFKIESEKLMIEVKSINSTVNATGEQDEDGDIPINLPGNENKFIERINRCIELAEAKEDAPEDYKKVVVIHLDPVMLGLNPDLPDKVFHPEFIKKTSFIYSSLDGLIFLPPKIGFIKSYGETPPGPICYRPIGYVKGHKMMELLSKINELEVKLLEE